MLSLTDVERSAFAHSCSANMQALTGTFGTSAHTTATSPKRPASRKSFADLPSPVREFKQAENLSRLVAVLVGDDGNDGGLAAVLSYRSTALPFSGTTTVVACPFISARNLSALGSMIGNEP
jgi:hypothetical protein